ncbi:MAG TPA: DUF805 domain-containing protein [Pseudonocardia sp.]|jgi:uncharacterized membrane protein YhaH (DUF805 family)
MQWFMKALRQYADFSGRARRREFWMFSLVYSVIAIGLLVLVGLATVAGGRGAAVLFALPVLFMAAMIIPGMAVTTRRLHDTNRSGWWQLISLVPFGSIVLFVFEVLDGDPSANRYGPDPKAAERMPAQYPLAAA